MHKKLIFWIDTVVRVNLIFNIWLNLEFPYLGRFCSMHKWHVSNSESPPARVFWICLSFTNVRLRFALTLSPMQLPAASLEPSAPAALAPQMHILTDADLSSLFFYLLSERQWRVQRQRGLSLNYRDHERTWGSEPVEGSRARCHLLDPTEPSLPQCIRLFLVIF